jgi:hypothetical protein
MVNVNSEVGGTRLRRKAPLLEKDARNGAPRFLFVLFRGEGEMKKDSSEPPKLSLSNPPG